MKAFWAKLALFLLPVALYLCVFCAFEPNNYFGLRKNTNGNAPIARIRAYQQNPAPNIIVGDSRMAHFDMALVEQTAGEPFANVAYGGASLEESVDEFYYLYENYPNIQRVVFGLSFYTLNINYRTVNRMQALETQLANPAAYVLNLEYNINMLTALSDKLRGLPDVEETAEHTPDEYVDENGAPLAFRRDLMDYTETLAPICANYAINETALARLLEMAEFCERNNVALTLVLPPMDESVRALVCEPNGIDAAMQPVLARLRETGATVLDYEWTNVPDYPDTAYYDGFHLDTRHGLPQWTQTLFSEVA